MEEKIQNLCSDNGTGFEVINDQSRDAFLPLLFGIEEPIVKTYEADESLKDSDVIKFLKNLRDNIFNEDVTFNELEKNIFGKIARTLENNKYSEKDVRMSLSYVLQSVKRHRAAEGVRGYLDFITKEFDEMREKSDEADTLWENK